VKLLNNQKGIAMPLALITLLVSSLLGTALWQYGVNHALQVARSKEKMQTYYIARSGADAIAQHITSNPSAAAQLIAATGGSNRARGNVGNGFFEVRVARSAANANLLQVMSVGRLNGGSSVSSEVVFNMPAQTRRVTAFARAITQTSSEPLDLNNMDVTGVVYSSGQIQSFVGGFANHVDAGLAANPSAFIPSLPTGTLSRTGNHVTVSPGFHYPEIITTGNGDITFVTGAKNTTVQVVVDRLEADRNIILQGDGRLEIFITGSAEIKTGNNRTANRANNEGNLIVYIKDDASFALQANVDFHGYIYGPGANVYVQSGQTSIFGSVVAKRLLRRPNNPNGPNGDLAHRPLAVGTEPIIQVGYRRGHWSD